MERTGQKVTAQRAVLAQKILWHLRWVFLLLIICLNIFAAANEWKAELIICINGIGFSIYFLLNQLEKYVECLAECRR